MESPQKPKPTPVMVLKAVGLSISFVLAFLGVAYAGYKHMLFPITPCVYLAVSSGYGIALLYRYLRGWLLRASNPNLMRAGIFVGSVVLTLSLNGCVFLAFAGFTKIRIFQYKDNEVYVTLVPCVLAAFWSAVLIYDSICFRRMWERKQAETRNAIGDSSRLISC